MRRSRSSLVLLVLVIAFVPALAAFPVVAQDATPGIEGGGVTILPPDEPYAGVSLGEWNARSWQWAMSVPMDVNPSFDPDGNGCEIGQVGPVFFVPASYADEPVTIPCVVPEGTAIFVGVGGTECSTVEPPPFFGRDEAELQACAAAATDGITDLQASVNGVAVPDLDQYRSQSPVFTLNLLAGQLLRGGSGRGAVGGGWLQLHHRPPATGRVRDRRVGHVSGWRHDHYRQRPDHRPGRAGGRAACLAGGLARLLAMA